MIYRIKTELYRFQSIFISPENDEAKRSKIADHWKSLERNSVWYHRTGIGIPENEDTIKKQFESLFETFPSEMSLVIPPSKPPDITMVCGQTVMAFSTNIESRCPSLLVKLKEEGVIVDYPYTFSLKEITDWLESDKTLKKWPRLKRVSSFPVEIKYFGSRYTVYNPNLLKDYRIRLFCCTNWQHDLVDTGRTKGQWNSWGVDEKSRVKYFTADTGRVVVFKKMPPAGTFLFRIPESSIYFFCTEEFKDACETHAIEGLTFEKMEMDCSYR